MHHFFTALALGATLLGHAQAATYQAVVPEKAASTSLTGRWAWPWTASSRNSMPS